MKNVKNVENVKNVKNEKNEKKFKNIKNEIFQNQRIFMKFDFFQILDFFPNTASIAVFECWFIKFSSANRVLFCL